MNGFRRMTATWLLATSLGPGAVVAQECTVVRMDPDEVTIPAEGGDIDATLTIGPVPDDDCELICLFSFSRPGFTLSGCSGDSRCRLDWGPFKPTGNPNECITSLTNPIPPNTGPPRMGTLYSFSAQDAELRDNSLALDTLVIRQEGNAPPFSGCRISPRNMHLSFHRPEFYLPEATQYIQLPPRILTVEVLDEGEPVAGAEVTLTASQPAFPDSSALPVETQSSSLTDEDGNAKFLINPLANGSFDRTGFQAVTSVGEQEFTCQSTVTAGLGTMLQPYLARLPEIVEMLALVREVQEEVLAGNPEAGPEIDAIKFRQQMWYAPLG